MDGGKLLLVEDDNIVCYSLKMFLENQGLPVDVATHGDEAWKLIKERHYPVVLSDINLPGMNGKVLLSRIKQHGIDSDLILFTGYGSVSDAVECVKKGALDYFTKPIDNGRLLAAIKGALDRKIQWNVEPKNGQAEGLPFIAFQSEKMRMLIEKARIAADTDATILIKGQSGTGKTLLASFIHHNSNRARQPFVEVSCGALSEGLLESELFGHRKGSFTGADRDKKGKFEVAKEGTIFLDDINSASLAMQIKLLRVIEEKTFERVGETETRYTGARVIAATNRCLKTLSEKELFREDLYHRLNVISLEIPSLNERKDDLPTLVRHFIQKFARKHKRSVKMVDERTLFVLRNHNWDGNIRELENVIERAVIFSRGGEIRPTELHDVIGQNGGAQDRGAELECGPELRLVEALEKYEEDHIVKTLNLNDGNRYQTAKCLGVSRATLFNKMRKYGLMEKQETE